jgi:hypothetical protein
MRLSVCTATGKILTGSLYSVRAGIKKVPDAKKLYPLAVVARNVYSPALVTVTGIER